MRSSYLGIQNSWFPIEKCKTKISIKKGSASPLIKQTQFPLTLTWASTVRKVQGLSLEHGVLDFDLQKQKPVWLGQRYTLVSRVKTYHNLCFEMEF